VYPYVEQVIGDKSTLDLYGKYWLDKVLEGFSDYPAGEKILETIRSGQVQVHLLENPSITAVAQYNTQTKYIEMRDATRVSITTLSEELAHAVQHQRFYQSVMNTKYKNYEFEAKAFFDIARAINGEVGLFLLPLGQESEFSGPYYDWMEEIERNKFFTNGDTLKFNKLCKLWIPLDGYGTEYLEGFNPQLLINYFKKP